jgi:O-antigen ligase
MKSVANLLVILLLVGTVLVVGLRKGFITEYTVNRIKAIESLENTTMVGRFALWSIGWKIVKDNFITGVGLGNFQLAYSKYTGIYVSRVVTPGYKNDPHNTYLSILAETGFIGLALFLSFLGYLILFIVKRKSENKVFALCLLIFLGIVSVKATLHFGKTYWACIALSYLISTCSPQQFYSEENPIQKPEGIEK